MMQPEFDPFGSMSVGFAGFLIFVVVFILVGAIGFVERRKWATHVSKPYRLALFATDMFFVTFASFVIAVMLTSVVTFQQYLEHRAERWKNKLPVVEPTDPAWDFLYKEDNDA